MEGGGGEERRTVQGSAKGGLLKILYSPREKVGETLEKRTLRQKKKIEKKVLSWQRS